MSKVGSTGGAKASGTVGKSSSKSGSKSASKSSSSSAKSSAANKTASGNKSVSATKGTGKGTATHGVQKMDKGTQGGKHDVSSLLGIGSPFLKTDKKKIDKTPQDKVNKKKDDSKKMNKMADNARDITGGASVKQKKQDNKVKDKKPASAGGKVSQEADKKKKLGQHAQDITGGVDVKGNKKEQGKKIQDNKGKSKLDGIASGSVGKEAKADFKNILGSIAENAALDAKNMINTGKEMIDTGKSIKETLKGFVASDYFKETVDMTKYKLKEMGGVIAGGGSIVSKISELNSMDSEALQIQKTQKEKGSPPPMTVPTGTPLQG